jgi:serine/threonine-protein kinase
MGEVYLAKDPSCGRELALKRIRPDLSKNQTVLNRFLREARVASRLTHPSIIPILAIENAPPDVYYTMPYVEGDTLRQILRQTLESEERHPIGRSIPALARIFLQICEAIAYTHSKGILHRDLKPENIIVGKYGEVMILDWGIADFISEIFPDSEPTNVRVPCEEDLTRPGKIAGTLAYMAPERLLGVASSVQADIYALGVILYYMLTLQIPFQRKTLAQFRKQVKNERLVEPIEAAPYRDIPQELSSACAKCLAYSPKERFPSVEELISEIKSYIEGHARWTPVAALSPKKPDDWQFQENVLAAKHIAIARDLDETEWSALMISRKSFAKQHQDRSPRPDAARMQRTRDFI